MRLHVSGGAMMSDASVMEDVPVSQGHDSAHHARASQGNDGAAALPPYLRAAPAFHEQAPGGMADVLSVVLRRLYPGSQERVSVAYSLLHACATLYAESQPAVRQRGKTLLSHTRQRRGASLRALPLTPQRNAAGPTSLPASPLAPASGRRASATHTTFTALRQDSGQSIASKTPRLPTRGSSRGQGKGAPGQASDSAAAGSAVPGGAYAQAYGEGMYAGRPSQAMLPTPPPRAAAPTDGSKGDEHGDAGSKVYRRARAKLRRGLRRVRLLRFAAGAFTSAPGLQEGTQGLGFRVAASSQQAGGEDGADTPSWLGARASGAAPPGRRPGAGTGDSATTGDAALTDTATRIAKDLLSDIAARDAGESTRSAGSGDGSDQGEKAAPGRSRHLRAALRASVLLTIGSQHDQAKTSPRRGGSDGCDDPLWTDPHRGFLTCFTATLFGDLAPEALLDAQDMTAVVQRSVARIGARRAPPLPQRRPLTWPRPCVAPFSGGGGLGSGPARDPQLAHGHPGVPVSVQGPRAAVAPLPGGAGCGR